MPNINEIEVQNAYDNTIIVTSHGYDKKFLDSFQNRFMNYTKTTSSYVYIYEIFYFTNQRFKFKFFSIF